MKKCKTSSIPIYNDLPNTGYLRIQQVLRFIPITKSAWWAGVKDGRYPKGYKLGPKTTGWRVTDIKQLLADIETTEFKH
jgi:prophage regulatory protein